MEFLGPLKMHRVKYLKDHPKKIGAHEILKKQHHLLNIQVNSGEWSNKLNVFGGSVNPVLADTRWYHAVPTIPMTTRATSSSWWFQPLWKIFIKMGIFPK